MSGATPSAPDPRARRRTEGLLAVAGLTAVLGATVSLSVLGDAWAVDANRNLAAAGDLVAGRFGADHGYVYSPLAALLTVPWTWLPAGVAVGGWLALRAAVALALAAGATRGWPTGDRALAAVAAVAFVPVAYDLLLGNVTVLAAAAVALVAWRRDDWRTGLVLGVVLAALPKPQLLPVLAWMLLYRRQALAGTIAAGAAATLAAAVLAGPQTYQAWIAVLRSVDYLSSPMLGNRSLFAVVPGPGGAILAAAAVVATLVALARGSLPGLVACMTLGMLVAPYTLAYAPAILLVVMRPFADQAPRVALGLALTASIGVIVAFPAWVAAVLAAGLALRGDPAMAPAADPARPGPARFARGWAA